MKEIKRKIAKWMEYKPHYGDYDWIEKGVGGSFQIKSWTPEKGGKDLTDVLAKFFYNIKYEDRLKFFKALPKEAVPLIGELWEWVSFALYLQNPDNAETILRAIGEVIE